MNAVYTGGAYTAAQAIDGSMSTICASTLARNPWLSVRVPGGTPIGYVAVHNRRDAYAYLLGNIEVWIGTSMGDTSASAVLCGAASYTAAQEPAPYVLWCGGLSDRAYVTVRRVGVGSGYISVSELEAYIA